MANYSYGQVEINFADQTANTNGTVDIDVTTNGFTNISVLQFSVGWDSLVMTFNSIVSTNSALNDPDFGFGTPVGSLDVDEGQFSLLYGNAVGDGNLPDGSVLFTVRFNIVGDECDETIIELTSDPTLIDAYDNNFNQLNVIPGPGMVMINGADCGGNGEDDLTFIAEEDDVVEGTNTCVEITVLNFIDIQTGTGTILWDPSVLSYTGLSNIALAGLGGMLNETNTDNGELKFIWSNPDPANPLTLDDGSIAFEICFDVIGSPGDMSPITLSTDGSLGFEWGSETVDPLPLSLMNGKITVTEMVEDPVIFNVSSNTAEEGETNVCVNFSVENFNNILGVQYVITWDGSLLGNATPTNFNLADLNVGSFNIDGDCATLSWSGIDGINVPDGTIIYSMCFDAIGDCVSTSPIEIVDKGNTQIEVTDGNAEVIPNVLPNAGSITIECESLPCEVVSVDNTCSGAQGGNVIVNVPTENCTYSWADGNGMEVATTKNLLGVAAGTYILTVSCNGVEECMVTATVDNFPSLSINDDVENASCGDLGSINVTVSLGSGNYSYNWNPAQADSPNISDLEPGPYQLTVTDDDTGCTQTASFNIANTVEDLVVSSMNVSDEMCQQDNGSISLTIDGGCEPYSYEWSDAEIGNTPFPTDLSDGSYQVTITDNSSPANMLIRSFTVNGFIDITESAPADITPSSGSDGVINIQITGGSLSYDYNWSGPTSSLPNSNSIVGLMDGTYSVTVTDSEGCEYTMTYIVPFFEDGDNVKIGEIQANNNASGFSLLCNGDMNGIIVGSITSGTSPYTVELSGDESRTIELADAGTFTIDNLSAGTYTVSVSNAFNSITVADIIITEPEALVSAVENGCDNEEQCDGFIDVNASGGFGVLTYDWNDPDLDGDSVDNLCEGSYTVLVTDENGCQLMESVDIVSCDGPVIPIDCYQVRDVITPNGDGMNDQFAVSCISDFPSSLEIYDRWGKLVFNQDVYDGSWMGISNSNEELIEGGYMYIINIDFGQGRREIMKGTVTLLRD